MAFNADVNNYNKNDVNNKGKIKTLGPVPNSFDKIRSSEYHSTGTNDNKIKTKTLGPVPNSFDKIKSPEHYDAEMKNIKTLGDISSNDYKNSNSFKDVFNRVTNNIYTMIPYLGKSSLKGDVVFDRDVEDAGDVKLLVLRKGQEVYFGSDSLYSTISEDITIPITTRKLIDNKVESIITGVDARIRYETPNGLDTVYEMRPCNDYDCSIADKEGRLRISEISQPQLEKYKDMSELDDGHISGPPSISKNIDILRSNEEQTISEPPSMSSRLFRMRKSFDLPSESEPEHTKDDDFDIEL